MVTRYVDKVDNCLSRGSEEQYNDAKLQYDTSWENNIKGADSDVLLAHHEY